MRVMVIGAGIIGVCTAYFLRRAGYDVTVHRTSLWRRTGGELRQRRRDGARAMSGRGPRLACRARCCPICCGAKLRSSSGPRSNLGAVALDSPLAARVRRRTLSHQPFAHAAPRVLQSGRAACAARLCTHSSTSRRPATCSCSAASTSSRPRPTARTLLAELGVRHVSARRGAVPCPRTGAASGDAAGRRTPSARRRNGQLRLLRAPVKGHRRHGRRRVPLRRRSAELRRERRSHRCAQHDRGPPRGRHFRAGGRDRQRHPARAAWHPTAADRGQRLLGDRADQRVRARTIPQRDGRDLQGGHHPHGQPHACRRHGRTRNAAAWSCASVRWARC